MTSIFGRRAHQRRQWTSTNEQAQLNFPSGFTGSNAARSGSPAARRLRPAMAMVRRGRRAQRLGEFDQAKAASDATPSSRSARPACEATPPVKPHRRRSSFTVADPPDSPGGAGTVKAEKR